MKSFATISLALAAASLSWAQTESETNKTYRGDNYEVIKIMVESDVLEGFQILENRNGMPHNDFVQQLDPGVRHFIINASITDAACHPLGYYTSDYQEIQPVNLQVGQGNFYLKPNGALLFTQDEVVICESGQISAHHDVRLGIQSGPMLISDGNIHPVFNPQSSNRNIRCGVGLYESNGRQFLVFAKSTEPVTFYNFASLFLEEYDCRNALCLESVGCAMNLPFLNSSSEKFRNAICNYLYLKLD